MQGGKTSAVGQRRWWKASGVLTSVGALLTAVLAGIAFILFEYAEDLNRGSQVGWAPNCTTATQKLMCVTKGQLSVAWFVIPAALVFIAALVLARARTDRVVASVRAVALVAAGAAALWALALLAVLFPVPGVFFIPSGALTVVAAYRLSRGRPPREGQAESE